MQPIETTRRVQGWMSGAAVFGVVALLLPRLEANPLGWLAALVGVLPAVFLPDYDSGRFVSVLRGVWSLPAMALSLHLCAAGLEDYSFVDWNVWVPSLLILLLGWRGSVLTPVARTRLGKLMCVMLCVIAAILFLFTIPRVELRNYRVRSWDEVWEAAELCLLVFASAGALIPSGGAKPGCAVALVGSGAAAITVGAEGAALAGLFAYPFLTICDAAVFGVRMGPFAASVWALAEAALLVVLLGRMPGKNAGKAVWAVAAYGLSLTMPWPDWAALTIIIVGAVLSYLPALWSILHKGDGMKNKI